jgi:hypothetical protein
METFKEDGSGEGDHGQPGSVPVIEMGRVSKDR